MFQALKSIMHVIFISFLFKFLVSVNGNMDFTYSAADLYRLIQTEQLISKKLESLAKGISDFDQEIRQIRSYDSLKYGSPDKIIKNPLLSYQLVKRHVKDLEIFDTTFEAFSSQIQDIRSSYIKARTSFTTPTEADLNYAMEAIIRLRQTYNFTVDELSQGKLRKVQIEGSLTSQDLASIGMYAKKSGMLTNSRMFLDASLKGVDKMNDGFKENWADEAFATLKILQDDEKLSSKGDREDIRVLTEMDALFATDSLENLNRAFEDLCQMHVVKDPPITRLKCYLDTVSHPVRRISPLKIEVYHEDPQVVVIYDFMSDKEVAAIEDASFYQLKRSHTQFYIQGGLRSEPSIIRTTSQTWIHDLGHPTFGYLSKRIESVTGYYLSDEDSAEELQVASYRPGGHYSLHTDALQEDFLKEFLQPEDELQGDRIATFMLYLSNVELGGNTAFPMLNISVRPVKGSAILWGNLYPDGSIARNTLHGACPVVYGVKNIATKWIHGNDQMFTRHKCKPDKSSNHYKF